MSAHNPIAYLYLREQCLKKHNLPNLPLLMDICPTRKTEMVTCIHCAQKSLGDCKPATFVNKNKDEFFYTIPFEIA